MNIKCILWRLSEMLEKTKQNSDIGLEGSVVNVIYCISFGVQNDFSSKFMFFLCSIIFIKFFK